MTRFHALLATLFVLSTLTLAVAACDGDGTSRPNRNTPGTTIHTLTIDGLEREAIVYVPELARSRSVPLVVMFHGSGGDGDRFYRVSKWRQKADEVGLIAVFPTALVHCYYDDEDRDGVFEPSEQMVKTKWANGGLGDPDRLPLCSEDEIASLPENVRALVDHPLAEDMAFMTATLDMLEDEYAIDTERVYTTGFSNGASFSARVGIEMADRIAAFAAHAGPLGVDTIAASSTSAFVSVGAEDDKLGAYLGVFPLPLDESLVNDPNWSDVYIGRFLNALSLTDDYDYRTASASGIDVAHFEYATSPTGADNFLEVAVIEGLAHQYPNGANHPMVMADVLWEFFARHTLTD